MNITTIAKNIHGLEITLTSFKHPFVGEHAILEADSFELVELCLPEGINMSSCINNHLTKLELPKSLKYLRCNKELFDYDTCETEEVVIMYEPDEPEQD